MVAKNKKICLAEVAGWYGMTAIVLAYLLVSLDVIGSSGYAFQLLNLTGACGVLVISLAKSVHQSVVLNIFWAIIAIVALIKLVIK